MACAAAPVPAVLIAARLRVVPRRIRVLTVGSRHSIQEGLAAAINRQPDMIVVAGAANGQDAFTAVQRYAPDVVTLDLPLPDMPGEILAWRVLAEFPGTRILAIVPPGRQTHVRPAWDAAIHGYLSRAAPFRELVHAIRQVQAGALVMPCPVIRRRLNTARRRQDGNFRIYEGQRNRPSLAGDPAHRFPRNRQ